MKFYELDQQKYRKLTENMKNSLEKYEKSLGKVEKSQKSRKILGIVLEKQEKVHEQPLREESVN